MLLAERDANMGSCLKALIDVIGAGTVIAMDDSSETIETVKKVGGDPFKGGLNLTDIIMC